MSFGSLWRTITTGGWTTAAVLTAATTLAGPDFNGESGLRKRTVSTWPSGQVRITVRNQHGKPLAARVRLEKTDHAEDSFIDMAGRGLDAGRAFWIDGEISGRLSPGEYRLAARIGQSQEYLPLETEFELKPDRAADLLVILHQWFDANVMGWYSADLHTHSYRYGNLDIHAPDRAVQFAAENLRPEEADRVDYGFIALAGRSAGLNLTVDNVQSAIRMELEETARIEKKYSTADALLMISCEPKLDPSGHVNVPGTHPGVVARANPRPPFPILDLLEQTRRENGVMVYTHPIRIPWFSRMTALEMFTHIVMENHGELFDIGPWSTYFAQAQLFGFWNQGVRVGAAATSDLGFHQDIGFQRTWIQADTLTPENLLQGMRELRTIASDGPIFAIISIDGKGPGEFVEPGTYTLDYQVYALRGLRTLDIVVDGRILAARRGEERRYYTGSQQVTLDDGSYVSIIARDGHDRGVSIPTAIFATGAPAHDKFSTILFVNDLDRRITRTGNYFLHLIATVNRQETIKQVDIIKNGELLRRITPREPAFPENFTHYPIIESRVHEKSWCFWPLSGPARHLNLSYPIDTDGTYNLLIRTESGKTVDAGTVDFRTDIQAWQGGLIQLFSRDGISTIKMGAHSEVVKIGDRNLQSAAWNRFGKLTTRGRQGTDINSSFAWRNYESHPVKIYPGSQSSYGMEIKAKD